MHRDVPIGALVFFKKDTLVKVPSGLSSSVWSFTPDIIAIRCEGEDFSERPLYLFSNGTYGYADVYDLERNECEVISQ